MIKGIGSYDVRGGVIRTRETAGARGDNGRAGALRTRQREVANAAAINVSSSAMGGVTHDDLSLSYIGGSASRQQQGGFGAPPEVYNYYAAIFREDSVCGAAVELRANIPYAAGFRVSGIKDAARLKVYKDALNAMRMDSMFSRISIDRDALGAFVGSLDFNQEKKTFDSILPLSRLDTTRVLYAPVHGMDPVVDIKLNPALAELLAVKDDARVQPLLKCIPKFLQEAANGNNGIAVPAANLMWIARPHPDQRFNSIYHRILPVFLIERALTRGTIEGAHKRQKPILHIQMGQGEEWAPSPEELGEVSDLFNNADADPLGAIVATRDGIMVSEVRSPQDFWKITDIADQTLTFKLRALGVSEAFLSADASFANADSAITVFIEQLRAERSQLERQVFYDKLFPQIAIANSFFKKGVKTVGGKGTSLNSIEDISSLDMPVVEWRRSLQPEGDGAYMELLSQLEQHNVPVPIRMFAAAGGVDLESLLEGKEQDIEDRKRLKAWKDAIKEFSPEVDEGMAGEFATVMDEIASEYQPLRPRGILARDYGDPDRYSTPSLDGRGRRQPRSRKFNIEQRDALHRAVARVRATVAASENWRAREKGLLLDSKAV